MGLIGDLHVIYMYWTCEPTARGRQAGRWTDGGIGANTWWCHDVR